MRKLLLVLLGLLLCANIVFGADPQVRPTITFVSKTNTRMVFTITNEAFAKTDSLILIMTNDPADSNGGSGDTPLEFETILTDTATGYQIDGLQPYYKYYYMLRSDSTTGSTKAYSVFSAGDTARTLRMNTENDWGRRVDLNEKGKKMYRHDSWAATKLVYDTITLVGEGVLDSTIWYIPAPYTSVNGFAYGDADSVKFTILVYAGYPYHDEAENWITLVDSLSVTDPGDFDTGSLNLPPSAAFKLIFRGDSDNDPDASPDIAGDSTYFKIRLNRSSFE